jgi:signal transduction histidine kinase
LAQLEAINQLEDSTRHQRSTVQLAELQLRYDTKLQQEKLDQLTIEKQQIQERLLVGGLVILVLLMGFVLFTNYRLRQKNRAISVAHLQGQTLERQRVAADLHDNLGTTLSSLQWTLSALNKRNLTTEERNVYQTLTQRLDQAYNDVRLLAHNLMPIQLAKTGLAGALQTFMEQINRNNAVRFALTLPPDLPRFEARTEFEVYSICLELCTNILKHAQASEARITLILNDNQLNLTVTDNGVGLTDEMSEGRGLQNIRARAEGLGGTWEVGSEPGQGVTHQITVPVRKLARAETHI